MKVKEHGITSEYWETTKKCGHCDAVLFVTADDLHFNEDESDPLWAQGLFCICPECGDRMGFSCLSMLQKDMWKERLKKRDDPEKSFHPRECAGCGREGLASNAETIPINWFRFVNHLGKSSFFCPTCRERLSHQVGGE